MSLPLDDEKLRRLLISSPGTAVEILSANYQRNLHKIALFFTRDADAAADVVAETFVHLWQNRRKISKYHERSILYYLVRVVKYKAITYYKNRLKLSERKAEYGLARPPDFEKSDETKIIEAELQRELRVLIEQFPAKEKECLLLRLDEDLSSREIAERLGVGVKAVQRSLTSATKRLRLYWRTRL